MTGPQLGKIIVIGAIAIFVIAMGSEVFAPQTTASAYRGFDNMLAAAAGLILGPGLFILSLVGLRARGEGVVKRDDRIMAGVGIAFSVLMMWVFFFR